MFKIMYVYVPQVCCTDEEKDDFWNLLCDVMMEIPDTEVLWVVANLNGHIFRWEL